MRELTSLSLLVPLAMADVLFTTPAARDSLPAGPKFTVAWMESGTSPSISELTSYRMYLYTGSNTIVNPLFSLAFGNFTSKGNTTITVPGYSVGGGIDFIGINSTVASGGNIMNFSNRFSFTGNFGDFSSDELLGLANVSGITTGPPTVRNVYHGDGDAVVLPIAAVTSPSSSSTSSLAPASSTPPASSPPSNNTAGTSTKRTNLSTSAIVGIAIAAVVPICSLCVAFFFGRRKAKANDKDEKLTTYPNEVELPRGGHHEISESEVEHPGHLAPNVELSGRTRPQELSGERSTQSMHELSGNPRQTE
ncbi:uncharacterized protein PAC_06668 [Phialocephala subalpina]|uniref:Yeast cell wall synthesis Kre9/Knh1-like N-terminal domain-containing protein n=1 Tax=Phialocephala subalpina TaxID=576137 RepID=A0A1L7WVI6_9HELO|nr:uncharacterized protein PAC_06668 [Phialocephala subalpina]